MSVLLIFHSCCVLYRNCQNSESNEHEDSADSVRIQGWESVAILTCVPYCYTCFILHRKRQNPLYESNDHEEAADSVSKKSAPGKTGCSCLCPCLLMVTLIALASLCFSLYVFTKVMFQQGEWWTNRFFDV